MNTTEARNTGARSSSQECAGCGERFEGAPELVRAVLESHACATTHGVHSRRSN